MSTFYAIIESQVNTILKFMFEDRQEQEKSWVPGPRWIQLIVQFFTLLVIMFLIAFFGLYLWNRGIHPILPEIISPIDGREGQFQNPYLQLIVTIIALMMFFN